MKINVVSKKLIKPRIPTPQCLNQYRISFTDEFSPPMNVRLLLFFTSGSDKIPNLEQSLALILPQFYLLAGRYIREHHIIDCGDQGAEFIEAEAVGVESMDLVGEMELHYLNRLLPRRFYELHESATCPLLSIQISRFRCGGVAVGIGVSHRIFDGSSLETFLLAWSAAACGGGAIEPSFDSPSLFPRGDLDCTSSSAKPEARYLKLSVKRFLFSNDAIARLRSEMRRGSGGGGGEEEVEEGRDPVISRVRVVCAVISKALIGVDRTRTGRLRPFVAVQAFNIRKRTSPPLPPHSCGNLAVQSVTRTVSGKEAEDLTVGGLAGVLGEAIDRTTSECSRILSAGEDGLEEIVVEPTATARGKSLSGEVNVIFFSDWSKFGFYEADLGWGKPVWASIGPVDVENLAVLMAERGEGGGIEAWVHLKLEDMICFEKDEGIRLFTKLI